MKNYPFVSIIIATKNSAVTLDRCLDSIKKQTYKHIELLIVDNNSSDETKTIARKYTRDVFNFGPERSSQRNFGAKKAKGDCLLFIDSDMELAMTVVQECITFLEKDISVVALAIPEQSVGEGFWASCKQLERSFYIGVPWMEAARFYRKDIFNKIHGYDESLISGEDFDLSQKAERLGKMVRINSLIYHNEGEISLLKTIQKKYYYSRYYARYMKKWKHNNSMHNQTSILKRYGLFFSQPKKLFANPLLGLGMLLMKTCEFGAGGLGYLLS